MDGRWLINLEELPLAVPMVQAALYQLVLDRRCGEYELPGGGALIACGNREPWCAGNGIAPEVLFFIQMRPELLYAFNPQSTEKAFPFPMTWEFVSNIAHRRNGLDPACARPYRATSWTPAITYPLPGHRAPCAPLSSTGRRLQGPGEPHSSPR